MVGVITTGTIVLEGHSAGKVENHWSRSRPSLTYYFLLPHQLLIPVSFHKQSCPRALFFSSLCFCGVHIAVNGQSWVLDSASHMIDRTSSLFFFILCSLALRFHGFFCFYCLFWHKNTGIMSHTTEPDLRWVLGV